jgi:endoglycosylceramidase
MLFKKFLLLVLVAIVGCLITSRNGKLYDNEGREIIFHGPNVVVKIPPYSPVTERFDVEMSFSEDDMKLLKSWGFNGIRLAVMWPGVEPKLSVYSQ